MQDVYYIEDIEQANTLLNSQRLEILRRLNQPRTCPELGADLDESPQKINYHIKVLERAGMVKKVSERQARGFTENVYQASAHSYWLSPTLVGKIGGLRPARDQASLRLLSDLAAQVIEDVGRIGHRSSAGQEIPSLSLSGQIHLPDAERRAEFRQEIQRFFSHLAQKYSVPEGGATETEPGQSFRLALLCYPTIRPDSQSGRG